MEYVFCTYLLHWFGRGGGKGELRIPSDGDDWIGAKINRSQQEPVGHGLLTPKSPMQNIQALNLSSIKWYNTTNKNKRKKIRKTPQAGHKSLIPPPPLPQKIFLLLLLKKSRNRNFQTPKYPLIFTWNPEYPLKLYWCIFTLCATEP